MADQAKALLKSRLDLSSRHHAKKQQNLLGSKSTGKIHSLRTFNKYSESVAGAGRWVRGQQGIRHLTELTHVNATAYLEYRLGKGISQKQLDVDRVALQFILNGKKLDRVYAMHSPDKGSRRYTAKQVQRIEHSQSTPNAVSTRIAKETGIRAHELLSLRRQSEMEASKHRQWHADRFQGREGQRYVVTGKGGLKREVLLSKQTVAELEQYRLAQPREVTDRGIHYQQHYNINGGNTWSKSFSQASQRVLGWSRGAHGLRHGYAQARIRELQGMGKDYLEARLIVSQELGHFRGEVLETYLR